MKISFAEVASRIPLPPTSKWPHGVWDVEAFAHGTMSLLLFAPRVRDYQTPHTQDELYIVLRGHGEFLLAGQRLAFQAGDVLFVAAGQEHRFENFSDDLTTWAVFWGPQDGEVPASK